MVEVKESAFFYKIKYLSYFIVRAFFIAIICTLSIIIFAFLLYYADLFINVKSGNYKNPLFNGYVIVSQSMVPTLNIDDAIFVKREDDSKYKVGDIISFSSTDSNYKGLTITHRIVEKINNGDSDYLYTTKGDNNLIEDESSVMADDIYGKVLFVIPKIGLIQKFLRKPINFIICILVPVVLVILYDGFRIFEALRSRT